MITNAPQGLIRGRRKKVLGSSPCLLYWLGSFVVFLSVVSYVPRHALNLNGSHFDHLLWTYSPDIAHKLNVSGLVLMWTFCLVLRMCNLCTNYPIYVAPRKFTNFNQNELFQLNLTLISVPHRVTLLDCASPRLATIALTAVYGRSVLRAAQAIIRAMSGRVARWDICYDARRISFILVKIIA
jgi:hypothetical protein